MARKSESWIHGSYFVFSSKTVEPFDSLNRMLIVTDELSRREIVLTGPNGKKFSGDQLA